MIRWLKKLLRINDYCPEIFDNLKILAPNFKSYKGPKTKVIDGDIRIEMYSNGPININGCPSLDDVREGVEYGKGCNKGETGVYTVGSGQNCDYSSLANALEDIPGWNE